MTTELWAAGLVLIATIFGSFGLIYLKKGSRNFGFNIINLLLNHNLIAGVLLYGLATILFIPALRGGELSVLYPVVSLTYVWVSFLSIKLLNENMNTLKWAGVLLIVFGVSMIGLGS